jgi:hypothetical protein
VSRGEVKLTGIFLHGENFQGRFLIQAKIGPVLEMQFDASPFGHPNPIPFFNGHIDRSRDPLSRFLGLICTSPSIRLTRTMSKAAYDEIGSKRRRVKIAIPIDFFI